MSDSRTDVMWGEVPDTGATAEFIPPILAPNGVIVTAAS